MFKIIIVIILLVLLYFYEESKNMIKENLENIPCIKMQENCDIVFITTKKDKSDKLNLIINNYKKYCKNCLFSFIVYDKFFSANKILNKFLIINQILKKNKYKYIIWMDSNKPINNLVFSFQRIINKYKNYNIFFPIKNNNIILDFFIIQNCLWSNHFIKELQIYIQNNNNNLISNYIKKKNLSNKVLGIQQRIKLVDVSEFNEIIKLS